MARKNMLDYIATLGTIAMVLGTCVQSHSAIVRDCLPVLAKDYYSYAQKSNLKEDYLRSIDAESWQELRKDNSFDLTGMFSGGLFSLSDDYSSFESKRTKYLESVHYNRNQEQALNILHVTTAARAYPAYEACLRSLSEGLRVWPSRESLDQIELHVKYANPASVRSMVLEGLVSGGSVPGAPRGHLWKDGTRWGVNQEKVFTIQVNRGTPETTVIVAPADGSTPVALTFTRADATLALTYEGTTDVLRIKDRRASIHTPNNNENRGGCPNFVGKHDGKYCTSRTTVSISTVAPHFLTNARSSCGGGGCPWTYAGPASVSPDGLAATGFLDNWGSDVDALLYVDEYERMGIQQCGGDGPIPVVRNQAVLFAVPKECLPIANIKWTILPDNSKGAFRFGDKGSPDGRFVLDGPLVDSSTVLLGSYNLTK
jgi:hypothetical protein